MSKHKINNKNTIKLPKTMKAIKYPKKLQIKIHFQLHIKL